MTPQQAPLPMKTSLRPATATIFRSDSRLGYPLRVACVAPAALISPKPGTELCLSVRVKPYGNRALQIRLSTESPREHVSLNYTRDSHGDIGVAVPGRTSGIYRHRCRPFTTLNARGRRNCNPLTGVRVPRGPQPPRLRAATGEKRTGRQRDESQIMHTNAGGAESPCLPKGPQAGWVHNYPSSKTRCSGTRVGRATAHGPEQRLRHGHVHGSGLPRRRGIQ